MIDVDIIGQLIPNPITMIVQLCSTLVLFLLVKKFLWEPIMHFFEVREDAMQSNLEASETAKNDALKDREEAKKQLGEASKKSEEIVEAAVKQANSEKNAIMEEARAQASAEKEKASKQIETERNEMYDSLKKDMVDVAMDAAGKLIGEKNVDELDRQSIENFIKDSDAHE